MTRWTRRELLKKSVLGTGIMAAAPAWAGVAENLFAPALPDATDRIEIGKSGVKVTRIAMGTGFNGFNRSSNQTRLGQAGFTSLIRHGFDAGVNFFDMADSYGSMPFMKNALKGISRDKVVLLSKIWFAGGGHFHPDRPGEAGGGAVPG